MQLSESKKKSKNKRCWWCGDDPLYVDYHDHEWGREQKNDIRLFEKICLEGFQAGLSWITVLRKRENFRKAFDGFDFYKIAKYTDKDVERLVKDAGIIRHRGKIESTINNAKCMIALVEEHGSFYNFLQDFQPSPENRPTEFSRESLSKMATSPESVRLSKALKKRGFSFVGPTTVYAFMQAMGMVNDHVEGCFARKLCKN